MSGGQAIDTLPFTQLHSRTKPCDCNTSARMDAAALSAFEVGKISCLQARPPETLFLSFERATYGKREGKDTLDRSIFIFFLLQEEMIGSESWEARIKSPGGIYPSPNTW